MIKQNIIKILILLFSIITKINTDENKEIFPLTLSIQKKDSLSDNSYHFYQLTLGPIANNSQQNLIIRVDEDKQGESQEEKTQYYFSDPDLYVSQENKYPKDPETSTWYCNEFGNDIVAISKEYIHSNSTFYLGVYCKTKCNYILNSYLDVSFKLNPFVIYGFYIPRKKSMVYEFRTRENNFEHLSLQIMGLTNGQYNTYINKEIPSSSKSYVLEPAWFNGYSYDLYKDSEEYCTNCTFFLLIKALDQDIFFRILVTYRDTALVISKGASLFDTIKGQKNRCYNYPMNSFPKKDSLIINFFLYGGSMIAKMFGFDSDTNKTYAEIVDSNNTFEIIGDRVLIISNEQIEKFKNESVHKNFNFFHFCLYSKQKSSYLLGLHYSSDTQAMQGLNFLNVGQGIKDYLPLGQLTKYKLMDLSYDSNIKITLEALQGNPKLYFMFQSFPFLINKNILKQYKNMGLIIEPNISGDKQSIFAPNEKNLCHQRSKFSTKPGEISKKPCVSAIIIECQPPIENNNNTNSSMIMTNEKNDCIFKLSTIVDKSKQTIKQKTTYKGLLSKDDYNDFLFNIDDDNVLSFTIVLNTVSGELKLSLYNIDKGEENKIFIGEKIKRDFLPKVINVQKSDKIFSNKSLKGKYLIRVHSYTFSLYALYFYVYDNTPINTDNKVDLYSIDLNLINGQMIQDFFNTKLFKVYNYEIFESKFKDIRITVTQRNLDLNIYIYDNVNKIQYEFIDREQSYMRNSDVRKNYDKIINFKNYLWTDLYDTKQIIIPYNELVQKVKSDKTLLFIVIAKKYFSSKNISEINYLNQNTFYLGITNNIVPLNLFENIPHQVTLNKYKNFAEQKYLFIHSDNSKKLSFSINVIAGAIDFQVDIKKNKIIFYKNEFINRNEYLSISPKNLNKYCQNTGCELILTISQISKESPTYMILAHSNVERPLQLIPSSLIQNQIQVGEKHFYILDFNPSEYDDQNKLGNILMRFRGGKTELYMKFYDYDVEPELDYFPNEYNYDYIGESTFAGKILHLDKNLYERCSSNENINNLENKSNYEINCRFFLTVKGTELSFYTGTRIEYSLFYSHTVLEINQGVPYTSTITAGEINYFKFAFDSNTKGIYITLYSSLGDADIYVNYGNNLPSFNNYIWRSSQSQMDSIFIDINDNFFVDNQKTSLEGLYTIMIYGYTNSTYTLTVSQGEHKIIQLNPGTPSICKVDIENEEKMCYFRVENFVSSKKIFEEDAGGLSSIIQKSVDVIEKDVHIVFSTKFIYGEGKIYVKLFKKTETEINLNEFPNEQKYDFSNDVSFYNKNINRNFLKIDINKDNENLSTYSMLLLSVKCKDNCLFEINSAKIEYDTNFQFIEIGRENLFYLNNQRQPLLLSFLYKTKEPIDYEFYSFTGSAEVKIFYNESYYDKKTNKTIFDYNHIANFKIEKNKPYYNYLNEIDKQFKTIKNIREIFIQVIPQESNKDLGFYVKLNYENDWTKIENLGKSVTYQLNSNSFNGYIDTFNEYENIILSVKSDDPKLTANVYVTMNELVPYLGNKPQEFNYPTNLSYTYSGKTNYLTSTVSIKIDTPKNSKNNYRIFYRVELIGDFSQRNPNLAKTISVLVSPLVNNVQRIEANPYTIYYNSQNAKNKTKSLFDLKKVDIKDDIFVIEISSCKGQFSADLLSHINYFNDGKNEDKIKVEKEYKQGKMVLTGYNLNELNYYLGISPLNNNENTINDNSMNNQMEYSNEVEFLLYYFTSNNKNYVQSSIQSYINPIYLKNGEVKLDISQITIKNSLGKVTEIKNVDISYKLFISTDIKDFSYMSSLCYLSKMENLPKDIKTYIKDNEIYVSGLKKGIKYFINIIIRNPISGELITLTPTILEVNKNNYPWKYIIIAVLAIIILSGGIYYCLNKYLNDKEEMNNQQNDIKNVSNLSYGERNFNNRNIFSEISQTSKNTTQYFNLDENKI